MSAHAIIVRVQKIKTESAHVRVWITDDCLIDHPDGTRRIDSEKLVKIACELAQADETEWLPENEEFHPHPIQTPPRDF
jgi:hypothetical protein